MIIKWIQIQNIIINNKFLKDKTKIYNRIIKCHQNLLINKIIFIHLNREINNSNKKLTNIRYHKEIIHKDLITLIMKFKNLISNFKIWNIWINKIWINLISISFYKIKTKSINIYKINSINQNNWIIEDNLLIKIYNYNKKNNLMIIHKDNMAINLNNNN